MIIMLLIYAFIGFFQVPGLIKEKHWRELIVFSIFYTAAFILSLLYVLDIKILSQFQVMKDVTDYVLRLKD